MDTIHAAQAYAILMTALGSLIITFIALRPIIVCGSTACALTDRREDMSHLESSLDWGLTCWRAVRENILDTPCLQACKKLASLQEACKLARSLQAGAAGAQHQPSLAAETESVCTGGYTPYMSFLEL